MDYKKELSPVFSTLRRILHSCGQRLFEGPDDDICEAMLNIHAAKSKLLKCSRERAKEIRKAQAAKTKKSTKKRKGCFQLGGEKKGDKGRKILMRKLFSESDVNVGEESESWVH